MKNFKLTNETIEVNGRTLYRIECIKDFKYAEIGDKGGFVESEDNLSEEAWIGDNACVYGNARVYGSAWVGGHARIFDNACVSEDATIFRSATIFEDAEISGMAEVGGHARIFGNARIFQDACVSEDACVSDGEWSEAPFQVQGSRHSVNMYSPTYLKIGSDVHTLSFWKENFEEIVKKFKYTTEQIEEYKNYIYLAIEKYAEKC